MEDPDNIMNEKENITVYIGQKSLNCKRILWHIFANICETFYYKFIFGKNIRKLTQDALGN